MLTAKRPPVARCCAAGLFLAASLSAGLAHAVPVPVTTLLEDGTNGGGFFVAITFEDVSADTVRVTADIGGTVNDGITKGDILGIFLDIEDEALLPSMLIDAQDPDGLITAYSYGGNTFGSFGSNVNLNGSSNPGPYDISIAFGTQGNSGGGNGRGNGGGNGGGGDDGGAFNQRVSFELVSAGLGASAFDGRAVGARVQSIEGVAGFAAGSSKPVGTVTPSVASVPLPGSLALLGAGLVGLSLQRRRVRLAP